MSAQVSGQINAPIEGQRNKPALENLVLKPMELSDLERVMPIEQQAYSHPWSLGNFEDSLYTGYTLNCLWHEPKSAAKGQPELLGYSVCMPVIDEVHLLNITVAPRYWRQGLGRYLLNEVHAHAQRCAASALWLEVRPSNVAALMLYQRYGFMLVGRRRGYYPASEGAREDALLLKLVLNQEGAQT